MEHEAEDIRFDHELAKACHRCRVVWVTALVTMEVGGGRAGGGDNVGKMCTEPARTCVAAFHALLYWLARMWPGGAMSGSTWISPPPVQQANGPALLWSACPHSAMCGSTARTWCPAPPV